MDLISGGFLLPQTNLQGRAKLGTTLNFLTATKSGAVAATVRRFSACHC